MHLPSKRAAQHIHHRCFLAPDGKREIDVTLRVDRESSFEIICRYANDVLGLAAPNCILRSRQTQRDVGLLQFPPPPPPFGMDHLGFFFSPHSIRPKEETPQQKSREEKTGGQRGKERQTEAAPLRTNCFSSFAERFTIFLSSPSLPRLFCGVIRTCSGGRGGKVIAQNSRLVSKISRSIFVGGSRVFGGLSLPCLESHEAREETLTIQYAYSKDTFFTYVSGGTSL